MMYTKEHIKGVLNLWETSSVRDIADKLNLPKVGVSYLASQIRLSGHVLPKKRILSKYQSLIKECLSELN